MSPFRLLSGCLVALSTLAGCGLAPAPEIEDAARLAPPQRSLIVSGTAEPGGTLTLRLETGPAFSSETEVELLVTGHPDALPLEVVRRRQDRLEVAWPMTACGRFGLSLRDIDTPRDATAEIPATVTRGCVPPPTIGEFRPARVDEATGRWTRVLLEVHDLQAGDRLTLEHRDDPRIAPADFEQH
jgi:hypothetical protein